MIGVTIAIGQHYLELAERAAESCRRYTGLDVLVISSLLGFSRVSQLKLRLFEPPLSLRGTVLWFDADMYFCRSWDLSELCNKPEVAGVHDYDTPEVMREAGRLGLHWPTYINGGLWVANSDHHRGLFARAASLYDRPALTTCCREQFSINLALRDMRTPVRLLDRRYNWITHPEAATPDDVVVLHAAGGGLQSANRKKFAEEVRRWQTKC